MSNKLVQIHFDFHGPFGAEMSSQLVELAESINQSRGSSGKSGPRTKQITKRVASTCSGTKTPLRPISKSIPPV